MTASDSTRAPRATPDAVAMPREWASHQPAVRRALIVVLIINVGVVSAKLYVGWATGSLTVLGAALESGLDLLNLIIGMKLVSIAARAPDEDHPYGHDKFESLGTLAIVGFLSISCFELLREAVSQVVHRVAPLRPSLAEVAVLAVTALANVVIVWYERKRGRELDSAFLMADAAHTGSDLYVTLLAITSLVLAMLGLAAFDAPLAILVALMIARNGYGILRGSIPVLVDQRAVDAARIRQLVGDVPRVRDVRVVRSRATQSGLLFAEVTIGVAAASTVADAHAIADAVEAQIRQTLGAAEVTVHVEPA
jgi:cation diffusion facilitator family transporter